MLAFVHVYKLNMRQSWFSYIYSAPPISQSSCSTCHSLYDRRSIQIDYCIEDELIIV